MQRILIVDDEPSIREVVSLYLKRDGYSVREAADGDEALKVAYEFAPDLIVLDLMLPKKDGMEVFRTLSVKHPVPVIMLTARGEETDRIVGLTIGADDYVTKPFSPAELVARVKAVLRRVGTTDTAPADPGERALIFPGLTIDPRSRTVLVAARKRPSPRPNSTSSTNWHATPARSSRASNCSTASGPRSSMATRALSPSTSAACARKSSRNRIIRPSCRPSGASAIASAPRKRMRKMPFDDETRFR